MQNTLNFLGETLRCVSLLTLTKMSRKTYVFGCDCPYKCRNYWVSQVNWSIPQTDGSFLKHDIYVVSQTPSRYNHVCFVSKNQMLSSVKIVGSLLLLITLIYIIDISPCWHMSTSLWPEKVEPFITQCQTNCIQTQLRLFGWETVDDDAAENLQGCDHENTS